MALSLNPKSISKKTGGLKNIISPVSSLTKREIVYTLRIIFFSQSIALNTNIKYILPIHLFRIWSFEPMKYMTNDIRSNFFFYISLPIVSTTNAIFDD